VVCLFNFDYYYRFPIYTFKKEVAYMEVWIIFSQ